jgi:transposase
VVDLQSDMILAAEIYPGDHADTQTLVDSVMEAVENVNGARIGPHLAVE